MLLECLNIYNFELTVEMQERLTLEIKSYIRFDLFNLTPFVFT
jgi:hypothetical protein